MKRAICMLGILALLLGNAGQVQSGPITLTGLTAATQWDYSTDPLNTFPTNYNGDDDSSSRSVSTSMPYFTVQGNGSSADFQASISTLVSQPTPTSLTFSFSGVASTDSSNDGSHFLHTYAHAFAMLTFTVTDPITLTLNLAANPVLKSSGLLENTSGQAVANIALRGRSVSDNVVADMDQFTNVGGENLPPATFTDRFSRVVDTVTHATSQIEGATSLTVTLGPGNYLIQGDVEADTNFYASNSSMAGVLPYGSGAFTDPLMNGHGNAGPSAVPEPSSLALLGIAGATFAGYFGWRRRKLAVA